MAGKTPLTVRQRADLIARLLKDQPDAGQKDFDVFLGWAENVMTANALLDSIMAEEVTVRVANGKVTLGQRSGT